MVFKILKLFSRKRRIQNVNVKPLEVKEISERDLEKIKKSKNEIIKILTEKNAFLIETINDAPKYENVIPEKLEELKFTVSLITQILKNGLDELNDIDNLENFEEKIKNNIASQEKTGDLIPLITTLQELAATLGLIDRQ